MGSLAAIYKTITRIPARFYTERWISETRGVVGGAGGLFVVHTGLSEGNGGAGGFGGFFRGALRGVRGDYAFTRGSGWGVDLYGRRGILQFRYHSLRSYFSL